MSLEKPHSAHPGSRDQFGNPRRYSTVPYNENNLLSRVGKRWDSRAYTVGNADPIVEHSLPKAWRIFAAEFPRWATIGFSSSPVTLKGHSLRIYSAPIPTFVRCWPNSDLGAAMQRMSAKCHVWTAPGWQELSSRLQAWSVQLPSRLQLPIVSAAGVDRHHLPASQNPCKPEERNSPKSSFIAYP